MIRIVSLVCFAALAALALSQVFREAGASFEPQPRLRTAARRYKLILPPDPTSN